jgi:hypothetical protein
MSSNESTALDLDTPIWGAAEIAREIGRSERATFHLLESGSLPATKVGGRWVTSPRRLREHLLGNVAA